MHVAPMTCEIGRRAGGAAVLGAGGTYSKGIGVFGGAHRPFSGREGASIDRFTASGAFVGGPEFAVGHPPDQEGGTMLALGAFAGIGVGAFLTNANDATELKGTAANTYSFNLGVGPVKFSAQAAESNGIWIASATVGSGCCISVSTYPTNTTADSSFPLPGFSRASPPPSSSRMDGPVATRPNAYSK